MNAHRCLLDCLAHEFDQKVADARDAILARRLLQPQVALILGSGLGDLAAQVEHPTAISYEDIPHFSRTHVAGHAGRLVLGYLSGIPVVLMQGRTHRYEGSANVHVRFPVYCMHALGARTLIATNAAGGLNTRFQKGDLMVLDGHIDLLWARGMWQRSERSGAGSVRGKATYDFDLMRQAKAIASKHQLVLHQGCYLATLGPTYETRAEYRMFRQLGADAVGMSTVPEVLAARQLGMGVLAFSVITNVASTDIPQSTTHDEVIQSVSSAGRKLMTIVRQILDNFAGQPD